MRPDPRRRGLCAPSRLGLREVGRSRHRDARRQGDDARRPRGRERSLAQGIGSPFRNGGRRLGRARRFGRLLVGSAVPVARNAYAFGSRRVGEGERSFGRQESEGRRAKGRGRSRGARGRTDFRSRTSEEGQGRPRRDGSLSRDFACGRLDARARRGTSQIVRGRSRPKQSERRDGALFERLRGRRPSRALRMALARSRSR